MIAHLGAPCWDLADASDRSQDTERSLAPAGNSSTTATDSRTSRNELAMKAFLVHHGGEDLQEWFEAQLWRGSQRSLG